MRYCYISRDYREPNSAGTKAKSDIETIMDKMGFVNIGFKRTVDSNEVMHFLRNLFGVAKAMVAMKKDDVLVLQYPMKKYYESVCDVAHAKGVKVVTQIHDLGSFRRKKLTPEREVERLNHSDGIIAHNDTMMKWLKDRGVKAEVVTLGIFDYLSPEPITSQRPVPQQGGAYSYFFVGSMSTAQNAFVYELANKMERSMFYLYGNRFEPTLMKEGAKTSFEGFAVDYDLMKMNKGDFGLSWYGESLSEGKGKIGEYMAYNNPHKVSLYLRCNAPVIISKTAGLAKFVEENGVGICVDSLTDLEQRLNSITHEQYCEMLANVKQVSEKIASGYYFETAFRKVMEKLKNG